MEKQVVQFQFGGQDVTLETGAVARQATGAVLISMGETQILATVVRAKNAKPGQNFFPLSVHYQEKTYAAGKIPGGYFKREGRPTEKDTHFASDRPSDSSTVSSWFHERSSGCFDGDVGF